MLDHVLDQTDIFIENTPKSQRKKVGLFFTSKETAHYMSSLLDTTKKELQILDPGAGSGILTTTLIQKLQTKNEVKKVFITLYESNPDILPLLESNMLHIKENSNIDVNYEIIPLNFILHNSKSFNGLEETKRKFDIIIGNPPYLKIKKNSDEALAMSSICFGAPNLYFLFTAMALHLLKPEGELVFIIPRSWTSGAYFKRFREYILNNSILTNIHLFVSRDKVFSKEDVLQETIILKAIKSKKKGETITISSSKTNADFANITSLNVDYNIVVSCCSEKYIYLPTSEQDIMVLNTINKFCHSLLDLGLKMKTGLTVEFRNKNLLRSLPASNTYPLINAAHFNKGFIDFPGESEGSQFMIDAKPGMLQSNKNYLFLKRFTSKEETRRLQPAIYLKKHLPDFELISTDNKINFIESINKSEIKESLILGLYVLYNSTLYDQFYRILNGSTQVNSTEMNSIPVPTLDLLEFLGRVLSYTNDFTTASCDKVLYNLIIHRKG